ncbi:hypothetical protein [uncultured Thiohalocapsa sp.]|uniref:hypothetical protein n=1 Tax=uncultured Thiohalocapsa sp. TaxID=768990 RepID=UPI0025D89AFB|nr:hypothetical protein [uncultured Thiohalocapsa sp.]
MSEEKATPASGSTAGSTSTSTRRSGMSGRRRSAAKPGTPAGPALAPERDDSYQRFPRIWPD